ncbi:major facilitator superfamily MFS_1, partial [mine drainage metagenome]
MLLTAVGFVRSIATQALVAWVPTEIALTRGTGISASLGLALTGMFAAAIAGQPVFGLLADRIPRRALLAASTAGSALSFLGYLATTGPLAYLLLSAFGFCTFSAFPLLMALAGDYVPRGPSSLANALVFGLGASAGASSARWSGGRPGPELRRPRRRARRDGAPRARERRPPSPPAGAAGTALRPAPALRVSERKPPCLPVALPGRGPGRSERGSGDGDL